MRRDSRKKLELSPEEKKHAVSEIREWFLNERNQDIGDLAADIMLDFFAEKIGIKFYNMGIEDARRYMAERAEELGNLTR